jgi:hypothetical protein
MVGKSALMKSSPTMPKAEVADFSLGNDLTPIEAISS